FPGFLLTALALAGLVVGLSGRFFGRDGFGRDGSPSRPSREGAALGSGDKTAEADGSASRPYRETTVFYALVGGIAFWASFGPAAHLYTLLYHAIPVFSFLRAPGRFGILVVLAMCVLALVALD